MPRRTRYGGDDTGSPPHELTFEEERNLRAAARLAREAEGGEDDPVEEEVAAPPNVVLDAAPVDDSATELVDAADVGHASELGDTEHSEDDPDATEVDPPAEEEDVLEEAVHDEAMVDGRTAQEEDAAEMEEAERVVEAAPPAPAAAPVATATGAAASNKHMARRSHPLPGISGKGGKHGAKRHRKVHHAASTPPPTSPPLSRSHAALPRVLQVLRDNIHGGELDMRSDPHPLHMPHLRRAPPLQ